MQNTPANPTLSDAAQRAANAIKSSPAANAAANTAEAYRDHAVHSIAGAADKASAVAGDLSARAADATSDAMHSASKMASDAGTRLGEIAENQKNAGADALSFAATKAKGMADQMKDQAPQLAGTVRDAADGVERASRQLRETSLNDMATSLSDAAKDRPLATLAAAFVAGIVLTRLLSA